MARPELGTKRVCTECGAKFYDLMKDPAVCPKCETELSFIQEKSRPEPEKAAARYETKEKAKGDDTAEDAAEEGEALVSFEEADEEAAGAKSARAATIDDEDDDLELDDDVEIASDDNTDALLEDDDEFDADVSDIIDADIEDTD